MHTIIGRNCFSKPFLCSAVLGVFAAAATLGLQAQQPATTSASVHPKLDLKASLMAPLDLSSANSNYFLSSSSSSSSEANATATSNFDFNSEATQPPPRRRYHRPNYSDRMHNADGSSKLAIIAGGGFTLPNGDAGKVFTTSYGLQVGGGYNFNKKFGILAEFGYDHFGMQGSVLRAQQAYYNSLGIIDPSTGLPADFSGLDANAHILSVTFNPVYNFYQGDTFGAYVTGGGGYFHKAVNFTLPQASYYCDYFGFCYPITTNANFDTHSADGGGFDVGGGLTFKPSRFGAVKFYTEVRYVRSNAKLTPESSNPSPISLLNANADSYVPITFGVRW
ncbi:MAG TPA: hypothetical protein VFE38_01810 [Edaphobacter sp.]|nr:hypothetical protein [Edaphobacter sp.]